MEQNFECKYCKKECKNNNSLRNHERLCKLNPNRQFTKFSDKEWQKNKLQEGGGTNQYIKAKREGKPIPKYSKRSGSWLGRHHTEESKQKISEKLSMNNHGGRCKWYDYNGTRLQGTWELAIAKKLDLFLIKWIKTREKKYVLQYIDDKGKQHTYNPDFYLKDYNCFLEIKGYWWGKDKRKMELVMQQNPNVKIKIIEKDLFALLTSTENKEDFIKLLVPQLNWFRAFDF